MKLIALAGAVVLGSLGIGSAAEAACSCQEEQGSVEQQVLSAMQNADYVALVWIKYTDIVPTPVELSLVAEFTALRVFKGPDTPIWVLTPADEGRCGVSLKPGETYLIYAQQLEDLSQVSTSRCMRAVLEAASAKDIGILEDVARRTVAIARPPGGNPEFARALSLIYAYAGCGDYRWQDPRLSQVLSEALSIADALAKSDPMSGYSQALRADLMSIWMLQDGGESVETVKEILALTAEALRINPTLAQAHVSRARVYAKSYDTMQAVKEIHKAIGMDPLLESAQLAQAEIFRLDGNSAKAEQWARQFIATTREPAQKANGYEWLGRMRRDIAYHPQAYNRESNLLMAKAAFGMSVELDPKDPWRLINYSAFLNEHMADFAEAEKQARTALELADLPAARNQLAAARYQALQARAESMDAQSLQAAIDEIETATGLSLAKLESVAEFREVVRIRLLRLQRIARQRSAS